MKLLRPFLALYARHWLKICIGIILTIITLLASFSLLSISGWFLAGSSLAGLASITTFNYMLPAAAVRGTAIIRTAARYLERLISHNTTFRVLADLRVFAFKKLVPLSPSGIAHFHRAELLNRLVADINTLDHLYLRLLTPLVSAFAIIIIITLGLSYFDPSIGITLGGIMLSLLFVFPIIFNSSGKQIGLDLTRLRSDYRILLASWLQGQAELSIFGNLGQSRNKLDNIETLWINRQQQQNALTALSQGMMVLTSGLTLILILWLAAGGVGEYEQPDALIALFAFATLAAFEGLMPVASAFQHLSQVMASAERVNGIINQTPQIKFNPQTKDIQSAVSLQFNKICFSYSNTLQPALDEINLSLQKGQHVVLLGKTGCGKSTLLQLITRAWDPQSGTIFVNNQPLTDYSEEHLRKMISVVTQRIHIFSDTLRQNLLIACTNAQDTQLKTVLMQVGLDALLEGQGLDHWLGEGGRQISGGEQCRIGIARVLLQNAPILLLDEPTEGLDAETEHQVLSLLRKHGEGKILIMVTHRLSTISHSDHIFVMDNGKIIEQGRHSELIKQQGHYCTFYQKIR